MITKSEDIRRQLMACENGCLFMTFRVGDVFTDANKTKVKVVSGVIQICPSCGQVGQNDGSKTEGYLGHNCEFVIVHETVKTTNGVARKMSGMPAICPVCGRLSPESPQGSHLLFETQNGRTVYRKEGDRWQAFTA